MNADRNYRKLYLLAAIYKADAVYCSLLLEMDERLGIYITFYLSYKPVCHQEQQMLDKKFLGTKLDLNSSPCTQIVDKSGI